MTLCTLCLIEFLYQEKNLESSKYAVICSTSFGWFLQVLQLINTIFVFADDKVTVLESEKRVWENSPEAQARREALNPWRHVDAGTRKSS